MVQNQRKYDHEYKVQAVKLAREIGEGSHTPDSAMMLAEELALLRKHIKD